MKLSLRKITGFGKEKWSGEKKKAAIFLKLSEKFGGKHLVKQSMKRNWYRHIDKAIEGLATERDAKHWKKMRKTFKKEIVGIPNQETLTLFKWLQDFERRIKENNIRRDDIKRWLPRFKRYMESCEENAMDNYIAKHRMVEA